MISQVGTDGRVAVKEEKTGMGAAVIGRMFPSKCKCFPNFIHEFIHIPRILAEDFTLARHAPHCAPSPALPRRVAQSWPHMKDDNH